MNRDFVDWRGYAPAVTTPFDEQGGVDLPAARTLSSVDPGFDGIPATPPLHIRPCEREIFGLYEDVSVGTLLPVCVYNWPPEVDIVRHTLETAG